jgi:hypothetical protein
VRVRDEYSGLNDGELHARIIAERWQTETRRALAACRRVIEAEVIDAEERLEDAEHPLLRGL